MTNKTKFALTKARLALLADSAANVGEPDQDGREHAGRVYAAGWSERSLAEMMHDGLIERRPQLSEATRVELAKRRDANVAAAWQVMRCPIEAAFEKWTKAYSLLAQARGAQDMIDRTELFVTEAGRRAAQEVNQ